MSDRPNKLRRIQLFEKNISNQFCVKHSLSSISLIYSSVARGDFDKLFIWLDNLLKRVEWDFDFFKTKNLVQLTEWLASHCNRPRLADWLLRHKTFNQGAQQQWERDIQQFVSYNVVICYYQHDSCFLCWRKNGPSKLICENKIRRNWKVFFCIKESVLLYSNIVMNELE